MSQQCEYHPLIHLCIIYSVYVRDNLSLITVICYNLLTKSQPQSQLDEQVPGWHWHCRCRALEWTQLDRAHRTLAGLFTRSRSCPPPPWVSLPPRRRAWRQLGAELWVRQPEPTPHPTLCTAFQPDPPTGRTGTEIQPLFWLTLPTHFTPSLPYAPSWPPTAHMIRASTQPPVLPGQQHPIDWSPLYSATQ